MVYYPLIVSFVKSANIVHYIHTYENNPWEKMAIAGIQDTLPSIKTTGFQQAVVPQASVNVFNSAEELVSMPLPDRILCVGQEPLNIINKYSESLQPNAGVSCGLRYKYLQYINAKPRKKIVKILITPEGVPSVLPMPNYVLDQLKHSHEYQLTFRFHQALPYKTVKAKYLFELDDITNATISEASLQEDLLSHDLCIYWGSSVALEALSMGMPLIHFDMQIYLSYDPLFRCKYLKWIVNNNVSLHDVIEIIDSMSDEEYDRQVFKAKKYIESYFYPVTDERLSKFLHIESH
jgi:hypothetical protein